MSDKKNHKKTFDESDFHKVSKKYLMKELEFEEFEEEDEDEELYYEIQRFLK